MVVVRCSKLGLLLQLVEFLQCNAWAKHGVGALLNLYSPTDDTPQSAVKATMSSMLQLTSSLLGPVLQVLDVVQEFVVRAGSEADRGTQFEECWC